MHQFLKKCTRKYSSWILPTVGSNVSNHRLGKDSNFGNALVCEVSILETNCLNINNLEKLLS